MAVLDASEHVVRGVSDWAEVFATVVSNAMLLDLAGWATGSRLAGQTFDATPPDG